MKICPSCHAQVEDSASFCNLCGAPLGEAAPQSNVPAYAPQPGYQAGFQPPFDHTAEFDPKEISDNKIFAAMCYIMGALGAIIALLAARESGFVMFHVRQSLKLAVVDILLGILSVVFFWTILIPIAGGILAFILLIVRIISLFQVFCGKAKEPAIIRSLKFLR